MFNHLEHHVQSLTSFGSNNYILHLNTNPIMILQPRRKTSNGNMRGRSLQLMCGLSFFTFNMKGKSLLWL